MLEHEFMVNVNDSLGQMKFEFDWPQLYFADPYKVKMFTETYYYFTDDSVKEKLSNYLKIFIVPDRIQEEIETYNAQKLTMERERKEDYNYWEPTQPVVNTEPKFGRNDRCPCGSGKKYK